MNNDNGAQLGAMNQVRRPLARRARLAPRVVSIGLMVVATIIGVHLGLGGPAVSPVSPAAITTRYGTPRIGVPAAAPVVERAVPRGHQHNEHGGGAHA